MNYKQLEMYPDYVFVEKQGQPNLSIQSFEWNQVEFKKVSDTLL